MIAEPRNWQAMVEIESFPNKKLNSNLNRRHRAQNRRSEAIFNPVGAKHVTTITGDALAGVAATIAASVTATIRCTTSHLVMEFDAS